MSFGLLLPAGLLALFALAIPLLLHLTRRTEQQPTVFAALRWLQASQRPRRKVRFDEWLLLVVRLLLLAVLALLLARPVLHGTDDARAWVVVAPEIGRAAARASFDAPDADWRWLAPGFPVLDADAPAAVQPTSSLLREVDASLGANTALTVLVPRHLGGLDGERPALRRKVDWHIVDMETPPAAAAPRAPTVLAMRFGDADAPALRYLRAAAAAWQAVGVTGGPGRVQVTVAQSTEALGPGTAWLVWLVPGALPPEIRDWIAGGGTALLGASTDSAEAAAGTALWRDASGDVLVRGRALGRGRAMQLTREFTPAALPQLLDADFPDRLRALFEAPAAPDRAFAEAHAPRQGGPTLPSVPRPLQPWLAALVAVLFVAERWLATSARRGPSS